MGVIAFALCLGFTGCPIEDQVFIYKDLQYTLDKSPELDVRNYHKPSIRSEPGNPGKSTYSMTDPNGTRASMTATGYAEDAVVADLDNDGNSGDVALAMRTGSNVTVILLVGDSLQSPVQYPTGTNPVAVAAGDVNGDQIPDLVTANGGTFQAGTFTPGSLSLLPGNGDGTFGAASTLTAGTWPSDVGLGDFNRDGILDIAVANGTALDGADITTHSVIVRLGTGNGAFGPEFPVATAQLALALQVVDFNLDGHDDIVTTGSVLLGNGDGTFAAPVNVAPEPNPSLLLVEDINHDGKPDIILGTLFPHVPTLVATVLIGNGNGTVSAPQHYALNGTASAVTHFDMDGDGVGDLLFSGNSDPTLLRGRGDGTFQWVQAAFTSPSPADRPSSATGAAVADFTGDGIPDVVVANGGAIWNGTLAGNAAVILPGLGGGRLGSPIAIPGQPGSGVVTGDWNGDAIPDLAFTGTSSRSSVLSGHSAVLTVTLGLGGGAFGPYTSTALPNAPTPSPSFPPIFTAFLNHDSAPDLLVGNGAADEVSVFLGDGAGGFMAQAPVVFGTAPFDGIGSNLSGIVVGDFNEDTHPDLVVAYLTAGPLKGAVKIAFGNGNGTFQSPQVLRDSIAATGVAAADFNGDGHLDLATAMETTTFNWDVGIYLGRGDGSFATPMPLGLTQYFGVGGLLALDADRDGKMDLVVSHGGGALGLRGLGDGTFAPVMTAPFRGTVMSADLNQDGWPDLLAPNNFLALYINELPAAGLQFPLLGIEHAAGGVALKWPAFYPDYTLTESPDLRLPFTPSTREITSKDGIFNVVVDTGETKAGFFRLKPAKSTP